MGEPERDAERDGADRRGGGVAERDGKGAAERDGRRDERRESRRWTGGAAMITRAMGGAIVNGADEFDRPNN